MPESLYLFCLARASLLPPLAETGLDGRSPLLLAVYGDLAAVCCAVSLEEFCGPGASSRFKDRFQAEPRLSRHQEVLQTVMRHSPVLPVRYGTLIPSREQLVKILQVHHREVVRFLEEVAGQDEWAVQGWHSRAKALKVPLTMRLAWESRRLAQLAPGRRSLGERPLESEVEQEQRGWIRQACRELAAALQDCALHCRNHPLPPKSGNGDGREGVVNWAFMVPRAAVGAFKFHIEAANRRHRASGLVFECFGPRPPYSFSPALPWMPFDPPRSQACIQHEANKPRWFQSG